MYRSAERDALKSVSKSFLLAVARDQPLHILTALHYHPIVYGLEKRVEEAVSKDRDLIVYFTRSLIDMILHQLYGTKWTAGSLLGGLISTWDDLRLRFGSLSRQRHSFCCRCARTSVIVSLAI